MPLDTTQQDSKWKRVWAPRLTRFPLILLQALSTSAARGIVASVALLIALWLLYVNVAAPLRSPAGLPGGVLEQTPVLDAALLDAIDSARLSREQHTLRSYTQFSRIFPTEAAP